MNEVRDSDPLTNFVAKCLRCGYKDSLKILCRTRRCPRCGEILNIDGERLWEPRGRGLLRYSKMIPVVDRSLAKIVGSTPAEEIEYGGLKVVLKHEFMNMSGSFKDRGTALAVSLAMHCGAKRVLEDSSGNTAISIALLSRRIGLKATVLIPRDAPTGKKRLLRLLNAEVIECSSRQEASERAVEFASRFNGVVYVDHLRNPMYVEGARTIAYEVYEEYGDIGTIVVPVGSGGLLIGLIRGFEDLVSQGLLSRMPRIVAVQGYEVAPLYESLYRAKPPRGTSRLADGIRVPNPPRLAEMVSLLRRYRGNVVLVSDDDIVTALHELVDMGFVVEPTSATVLAALRKMMKDGAELTEPVLLVLTGSGMKMLDQISELVGSSMM